MQPLQPLQPSLSDEQEEFLKALYLLCKRYRRSGVYSLSLGFSKQDREAVYRVEIGLLGVLASVPANKGGESMGSRLTSTTAPRLQNVVYGNPVRAASESVEPLQPVDAAHSRLPGQMAT